MAVPESAPARVIFLPGEAATTTLAQRLAPALLDGGVVFLRGELGAGKTTFARALLRALGVGERVKSPTYSLLERYTVNGRDAFHLDLYRIADAGELEWLGLDELDAPGTLVIVEVRGVLTRRFGAPEESVDARKLTRLEVAAVDLLRSGWPRTARRTHHRVLRIDVVAVDLDPALVRITGRPGIRHLRGVTR